MQDKDAKKIIDRYNNGTATEEEKALVEAWYATTIESNSDVSEERLAALKNEIYNTLPIHEKNTVRLWPRIAAAASVLLLLGTGGYFIFSRHKMPIDNGENIAPYSASAILKTGGKVILLDHTSEGKIGQTKVSKASGEQLIYDQASEPLTAVYDTVQIPAGGRPYTVKLSDGTKITLNAATTLRYPQSFSKSRNENIELITGEIYAEVVHHKEAPLTIITPGQVITDIGTQFNIAAYPDESETRTTLVEGAVKVSAAGKEITLSPGKQTVLSRKDLTMLTADINQVTAWKAGLFRFNGEHIEDIMRQLSRWYDIEVNYDGEATKEIFYGRVSRKMNIDEVLRILERSGKVQFKVEGRRVTVLSKS